MQDTTLTLTDAFRVVWEAGGAQVVEWVHLSQGLTNFVE
jgi:hypothetical protein